MYEKYTKKVFLSMSLHNKIKEIRKLFNFSQADIAEFIEVSQKDISLIENGKKEFIPNKYIDFFLKQGIDLNTLYDNSKEVSFVKTKSSENVLKENEDKNEDILTTQPKVPKSDAIEMEETPVITNGNGNKKVGVQKYPLLSDQFKDYQVVPLYNIEATAGLVPLFSDTKKQTPIDYLQIPNLPPCDGAVHVTGDSMYPILKSGDIVLYKQINDIINNIFWGEMYLISVAADDEEFITLKYIQKSEQGSEYVKLVSQNQHHQPRDIKIDRIRALAFVKASVRMNSMG